MIRNKSVTSIRLDSDILGEVRRQKINLSQIAEDAAKIAIGKPTIELLTIQKQHLEEELGETNKKLEELIREKITQEEIAERKRKTEQESKKLQEKSKNIMLEVWKELIIATTKTELIQTMDKFIRNNHDNPFAVMTLTDAKKTYENVIETSRWKNWVAHFRRELGLDKEEGEDDEKQTN